MASDDEDVPESGAVFTFGKSRFADNLPNKFWIREDPVVHVSCGDEHSAVVTANGKLFTFGSNDWGQLGHGNTRPYTKPGAVKSLKPEKVRLVACGRNHTLATTESGHVYSFGNGGDGQLGHGDNKSSHAPKAIESLQVQQYKMISCGADFSAALTADGRLFTWGSGSEGQTGLGMPECETPTELHLQGKVVSVSCGYYHMAVVTDDGSLFTCGETDSGKLGLEDFQLDDTSELQKVMTIKEKVLTVSCGGRHTAAVTKNGNLYTFGEGPCGELGLGSSCLEVGTPKKVNSLGQVKVREVYCGESHMAAITKHANLYVCGDGHHGKLGMGHESFSNLFKPTKVARFNSFDIKAAACGGCHMLVVGVRKGDLEDRTDSEAEAEKDVLMSSVSSTKSLADAVDGPMATRHLAATLPAGGAARNKRRLKNLDSLGNSFTGSLPPMTKAALPPLAGLGGNSLPPLNKLNSKPPNLQNMSMLPKIARPDRKSDKEEEAQERKSKERLPSDEDDQQHKGSCDKFSKPKKSKVTKPDESESEEETGSEEESEEERKTGTKSLTKTGERTEKKAEPKKDEEESEEEESESEEEEDSEEESKAAQGSRGKTAVKESSGSPAVKRIENQKQESEGESSEESEEEEEVKKDAAQKKTGKDLASVNKKEVEKEKKKKDAEEEEESSEEDDEDEDEDEDDEDEDDDEEEEEEAKKESGKKSGKEKVDVKGKETEKEKKKKKKEEEEEEAESEEEDSEEEDGDEEDNEADKKKSTGKSSKVDKKGKKDTPKSKKEESEEDEEDDDDEEEDDDDDDEDEEDEDDESKKNNTKEKKSKTDVKGKKDKETARAEKSGKKNKKKEKEDEDKDEGDDAEDEGEKKKEKKKGKKTDAKDEEETEGENDEEAGKAKEDEDENKNKKNAADKTKGGGKKKSGICTVL